jgi:2-haloacid dehalogenase
LFDVFGTVVDWRGSLIREGERFGSRHGIDIDWADFAAAWRQLYQPSMEAVRSGRRPWVKLDDLHRESLLTLLGRFGITALAPDEIEHLNRAWHRLAPWPDSVSGLHRLKRRYVIATLSNGNLSLLVDLARHAGLPWDAVLGAETARAYKPLAEAYLENARLLDLAPAECLMVAAHNDDLRAARALGFGSAFVARPTEYGPGQQRDLVAEEAWDLVCGSLDELAERLGC